MARRKFDPSEFEWWCDECDASLDEQPGFYPECGTWICTECGCVNLIAESEIVDNDYKDNDAFYEDGNDEDDIPEGCAACGGPYPSCKISCPAFDD